MSRSRLRVFTRHVSAAVLLSATLGTATSTAAPQLTPELVARVEWIEETAISPDGKWVAYIRSTSKRAAETRATPTAPGWFGAEGRPRELFLIPAAGGQPRLLASADKNPRGPLWSPDGSSLAFLGFVTERNARQQVYQTTVRGGEPRALTDAATDVSAFALSPDGRSVAYLAAQTVPDSVTTRQRRGSDAIVYGEPGPHVRLWVKELSGGAPRPITPADRSVRSFAWSPDGKTFALQITEGTDRTSDWNFRRLYVVPAAAGGEPALLAPTEGPLGNMAWSPDGKWLAFIGATSLRDPAPQSVFVVPVGKGEAIDRTAGYEGSAIFVGWLDAGTMLFGAIEGVRTVINRVGAKEGPIERLVGGETTSFTFITFEIHAGVSFDASARMFAAPLSTATHAEEVYVGTTDGRRLERLTSHNAVLSGVRLARQERTEWKSADGLRIEGIFFHPSEETPERRYPLVVLVHGGPELANLDANFGLTWPQNPAQLFAAHGYAVLAPNFRGSIGRGVAFSRASQRDLGGRELDDILSGIDHLVARGLVDSTRVAIHGMSHGGYLAALAAGLHSGRFKAAIASAPVTNLMSFVGSYENAIHSTLAHWDFWWYEHPGLLWDRSPMAHVHRNWAPLHIDHGLLDTEVPFHQSKELYQALRLAGAKTRLVFYPREDHAYMEEAHQIDVMTRYLKWLDEHLGRDSAQRR